MRTRAAMAALLALGAAACTHPTPPAAPRRGPVVVTVVIDQFAAWIANERLPLLPADGGFARLRREGTWYADTRYDHAATDTAPGHASLYTGRTPRETGIFANELPERDGVHASILRDDATHMITPDGPVADVSASIARLRVPTLADQLRAARPGATIISLSIKDRGAIFGGGHHPDAVIWFDPARDSFVTSTAFATAFPAWAHDDASTASVRALRAPGWSVTDPAWLVAHAGTTDTQPGEGDYEGWGTAFPHSFVHAHNAAAAMRASPFADAAVLRLARDALRSVAPSTEPLLLALSLSANDYVGHIFGPDSWEAWDNLRRLDAALGAFQRQLDAQVGAGGWSMVLSADHGVTPLVEAHVAACRPDARPCETHERIAPLAMQRDLEAVATALLGPGPWVLAVVDPYVYLQPAASALPTARHTQLMDALTASLRARSDVADVFDAENPAATCPMPADDSLAALACRSMPAHSGAALYVALARGTFFDTDYVPGHGTNHGTPYLYDRTIPLLARAPGVVAAGQRITTPSSYTLFHSIAARLLGLEESRAAGDRH